MVPIAQRNSECRPAYVGDDIVGIEFAVDLQHIMYQPCPYYSLFVSLAFHMNCTYRQQPLHNLTRNAQSERAHKERKLQHFAPRGLEDPVEREREQEEGDEV